MPRKSVEQRIKRAKKQGVALARTEPHAPQQGERARATFDDRNVSRKAAPGMGSIGRKVIQSVRAAYRAENAASGGGRPLKVRHEDHPRPVARVNGRKK